jgi:NAD(P)-dependent dehydrogenase (short-subunit alcohol dehydrogenase family)
MKLQKSGKIVNLASIAGRGTSVASGGAYAAAKGGIIAFTRKLSFELGPFGININAIAPRVRSQFSTWRIGRDPGYLGG